MNVRALFATLFFLAAFMPTAGHGQQTAQELFQAGLYQEEVQGNLPEAIEVYQSILRDHAGNREVAARAQLHIGLCYELLGRSEAERAYQAVLDGYADQAEVAGEARARLEVLRAAVAVVASEGLVARRLLEDDGCAISYMRPSPDGKSLAYSDLCVTLAVHVRDIASGTTEQFTTEGEHFGIAWSPDGRRIATADLSSPSQLKIIDLETGDIQAVAHMAGVGFVPDDWSSDGDHLSGFISHGNRSTLIVSLSSGERVTLASNYAQSIPRTAFSPDGRNVAFIDFAGDNQDIYVLSLATGERQRVTTGPEVDWGAVWSPDGTTLVYHNNNGSWALQIADGQASGDPKLLRGVPYGMDLTTNSWTSDGYYYASMNTVTNSYRIPVDPETARPLGLPEPMAEAMPGLLWNSYFSWSPDMKRIASTGGENLHHIHVSRGQSVTSFPIGDEATVWGMWWSGDGSEIIYTTRRGHRRDSKRTVYALNPEDGSIRELFPPIDSISYLHLSPDGDRMVFRRASRVPGEDGLTGAGELVISDLGNPENARVLATSSEAEGWLSNQISQPAFSPDGSHVMFIRIHEGGDGGDDFERSLWIVPADGSAPSRQLSRSEGIPMAYWDPSGKWLVFPDMDPDSSGVLSVVSIETGEKHEVLGAEELRSMGLEGAPPKAWSPDGRWIGFTETKGNFEFWVIADPLGGESGR